MNSFSFGRKVEIEGQIYTLTSDRELAAKALTSHATKLKIIGASKWTDEQKAKETVKLCRESLDTLLGAGAFDWVFSGHTFSVSDFTDLIYFLSAEYKAWGDEIRARAEAEL